MVALLSDLDALWALRDQLAERMRQHYEEWVSRPLEPPTTTAAAATTSAAHGNGQQQHQQQQGLPRSQLEQHSFQTVSAVW